MTSSLRSLRSRALTVFTVAAAILFSAQPALAAAWVSMPSGTTDGLFDIAMTTDENVGIAVGGNGALKWSSDGGKTWNSSTVAGGTTLNAVSFAPKSRTAWVVGASGKVLMTVDGGSVFQDQSSAVNLSGVALYGVFALNENTAWVVGANGNVKKTINGGTTWTPGNPWQTNYLYDVHFTDANNGWIVGTSGYIAKSGDGGATWSPQTSNTSQALRAVDFLSGSYGVAVGDNRTVVVYEGSTWQSVVVSELSASLLLRDVDIFNSNRYTLVGDDGNTAETTSGGVSFAPQTINSGNNVYDVQYSSSAIAKYAVGANGAILKYDAGDPSPLTGLALSTGEPPVTNDSTPTFVWNASTDNETSIKDYEYTEMIGGNIVGESGYTSSLSYTLSSSVEGSNTFIVRARDLAGNLGAAASKIYTVDTTPSASTSVVSASPSSVTADNSSTATITVTVKNAASSPLSGKLVTLTSSRPTSDTVTAISQTTNSSGQATFSVKSTTAGSSTFTATADSVTLGGAGVTFTSVSTPPDTAPSASASLMSASPSSVTADNSSTATITITVKNATSSALSGKTVTLASSRSSYDTITAISPTTNSAGQAVFSVRSTTAGTSSFTATADGIFIGPASVYFTVMTTPPPVPSDTVVSASKSLVITAPKKVRADGGRTGKVIVIARNAQGQVLAGKTVSLTSSLSGVTITPTQAVTSAYGIAKFQVKSLNTGTATFSATADGTALQSQPFIYFIPSPTTICLYPVVSVGSLVKLPDDSNPATQEDTAVYFYGKDCKRHAFPNSKMYFTWYQHFNDVISVTPEVLASMPLGSNVRYRPAIKMVKFTTVSKVYVVGLNGELRWVKSEAAASALYGPQWNKNIDDLSDAFYTNYTFGSDVEDENEFQVDAESDNATSINDDL